MGELSNDRTIHEVLTHVIQIEKRMREQRDAHTQRKQPATETDQHANAFLEELSTKLESLVEEDVALDHEIDALFKRVRNDVKRMVQEHRSTDREDQQLKKLAHDLHERIHKDRHEFPGKGSIALGSNETISIAQKMIQILEHKDGETQHDDDLARRVRRILKKAIEDLE